MFLDHTQRRITVGNTPLDEWSARRRDLYLTTHNDYKRHPCPPAGFEPTVSAGERPRGPAITEEFWLDCRQCVPRRVGIFQVVLCVQNDLLCSGLKTKSIPRRKFCRKFPDVKFSCLPKQPSRGSGSVLCKNKPWERNVLRDVIWNKVIYFEWDIFRRLLYHIMGSKKRLILFRGWGLRPKVRKGWSSVLKTNYFLHEEEQTNECTYLFTYSMEHSSSWEANWFCS
jgi:hypothetical protein